jgi:hypothetical protein
MAVGSFLFLKEQIKGIIIKRRTRGPSDGSLGKSRDR